jgi:hypothetical protein
MSSTVKWIRFQPPGTGSSHRIVAGLLLWHGD